MRVLLALTLALVGCKAATVRSQSSVPCPVSEQARVSYYALRAEAPEEDWRKGFAYVTSPSEQKRLDLLKILRDREQKPSRRLVALEYLSAEAVNRGRLAEAAALWETSPQIPGTEDWSRCVASIMRSSPDNVKIVPVEGDVNTNEAEYDGEPDLSGKRMFFTRFDVKTAEGPGEEIWIAELKDGAWHSRPLRELNTPSHESVLGSSMDGTTIFIFGNYGGRNADIFVSRLEQGVFTRPIPLAPPINSEFFESDLRPTADGKAVVFSSDRKGGPYGYHPRENELFAGSRQGNTDLYVSFITPDGFSKPVNLGRQINTPGAERNPFLHADGKTLYFASDGHPGLGKKDIFRTVRLDDTWTNWSPPENLGPQINTAGDESGFRLMGRGDEGLISSHSSKASSDIFRVLSIPRRLGPAEQISLLYGEVKDKRGNPVEADVLWRKDGKADLDGKARSRPDTGEYVIPLTNGKKYQIEVKKPGFVNESFPVDTTRPENLVERPALVLRADPKQTPAAETPRDRSLPAKQDPPKENVQPASRIPQPAIVYFRQGRMQITNPAALEPIVSYLKQNPRASVSITAHTDGSGSARYNRSLSEKRARSIYRLFVRRGISPARISYRGAGEQRPVASNRSGRGRQLNRRAVVQIVPFRGGK